MSEKARKDRSPNCPKMSLKDAVELVKKLYSKASTTKVKTEVVAGALGYTGLNGAALTTLGAINQYGLVDRHGDGLNSVSQLALQVLLPVNESQKLKALKECALAPKVFSDLVTNGFHRVDSSVIANHLAQNGFSHDVATKIAAIFLENVELAKLSESDIIKPEPEKPILQRGSPGWDISAGLFGSHKEPPKNEARKENVLASYSVPLGANEATIIFKGESLAVEDFVALGEYVELFKRQFERQKSLKQSPSPQENEITSHENLISMVLNRQDGLGKTEEQIGEETGFTKQHVAVVLNRRPEKFIQLADMLWRKR